MMKRRRPKAAMAGITDLPPSASGMRIGLFGGSFNPIHDGHVLVMEETLRRLGLDALWVLVTPGNPLKNHNELQPLDQRVRAAREKIADPRIRVTGFEAAHGFTYTFETLHFLADTMPDRKFVWIMGADSLAGFHRWERWRDIARTMPLAVYVRPGVSTRALVSKAAIAMSRSRIDEDQAGCLADRIPPAWVFLRGRQSSLSSSAIRTGKQPL
jgi:nicotinate-nucleotide adenylyltransferase